MIRRIALCQSPNNRMQRGGMDKVLRRGLDGSPRKIFTSSRVREALCPRADAGRYATLPVEFTLSISVGGDL
jgi:hypothetical protein